MLPVGVKLPPGVLMVTIAVAALVGSATDLAVTTTVGGLGMFVGAVYFPFASIAPQIAPAQPVPGDAPSDGLIGSAGTHACHELQDSTSLNRRVGGETLTPAGGGGGWLLIVEAVPPHPLRNTRLMIPKITSALVDAVLLFIVIFRLVACELLTASVRLTDKDA